MPRTSKGKAGSMMPKVVGLKQKCVAEEALAAPSLPAAYLARLVALSLPDGVWVELAGGARALARLAVDVSVARLQRAMEQEQSVMLAFVDADPGAPIVLGIVGKVGRIGPRDEPAATVGACEPAAGFSVEADADGRRVRVRAQEEIVLQCGDSSISLKRNGQVVIRGAYVETNATDTNRIKGGNVRIN